MLEAYKVAYGVIQAKLQATLLDIIEGGNWNDPVVIAEYNALSEVQQDMYREIQKALRSI